MNIRNQFANYFLDIYDQMNFVPVKGIGARMYDSEGFEVIDFMAGVAVNALGHAHPKLVEVLTTQAQKLWHVSNIMVNEPAFILGKKLITATCFDKIFLCNSGTEAVEAGLKLARRYAKITYGQHKNKIVSFNNSFHGRTLFAVTAGGQKKYSEGYSPLPGGIIHGTFNAVDELEQLIDENTAVVITEVIQAEGGIIPATQEFLLKLRQLCDKFNAILMFDEVQTGIGRTGRLFAYEHYNIEPDLISSAKGLGGGFPIGAILLKNKFSSGFAVGSHGSTFGGNPLACSVANAALEIINTPQVLNGVMAKGKLITGGLAKINAKLGIYKEIRGEGLLIGAELQPQYHGMSREIMKFGFKNGIALLNASANVTRITPPLVIPEDDIHIGLERLEAALSEFKMSHK